jgi:hypothetical protein
VHPSLPGPAEAYRGQRPRCNARSVENASPKPAPEQHQKKWASTAVKWFAGGSPPIVRFAIDSALEGDGFELLVPRHESPGFSAHGGRSLPDSPLEETGFEPEVPAREGWVPLAEGEPSQSDNRQQKPCPILGGRAFESQSWRRVGARLRLCLG